MRRSPVTLFLGGVLLWFVLPAGWLLLAGVVGTSLDPDIALYATPLLFLLLLVGLPGTMLWLARRLYGAETGASFRVRRRPGGRHGPPPAYTIELPRPRLSGPLRAKAVALTGLMFLLAFSMWTVAPFGCVWLASRLTQSTQPSIGPYLLIIVAVPLTMFAFAKALGAVNARYLKLYGTDLAERRRAAWLKSLRDGRAIANRTTLELVLISSVIAAVICLAVWFFFFAEMTSVIERFSD